MIGEVALSPQGGGAAGWAGRPGGDSPSRGISLGRGEAGPGELLAVGGGLLLGRTEVRLAG